MTDSDTFARRMAEQFQVRFKREIETRWDIFAMRHVTTPEDGQDFTAEQIAWVAGYEAGYSDRGFSA